MSLLEKLKEIRILVIEKLLAADVNQRSQYEFIIEKCGDLELLDNLIANYEKGVPNV